MLRMFFTVAVAYCYDRKQYGKTLSTCIDSAAVRFTKRSHRFSRLVALYLCVLIHWLIDYPEP